MPAILLLGAGCTNGINLLGEEDHEVVPPTDADGEADADVDADADGDDCIPPCHPDYVCYYGVCVPAVPDADAEADVDHGADTDVVADADGDADADTEVDVALDIDADDGADAEGVGDDDADADADAGVCLGGWFDPSSDLCWQDPPDETARNWDDAVAYCDRLSLGGYDNWHLPTISELRSLIRGCSATETGGSCGVTDSCLDSECWDDACLGCPYMGGPGAGGAYWPSGLGGTVFWCWSSSSHAGGPFNAFGVSFYGGNVSYYDKAHTYYIRCVRRGP